MRSSVSTSAIDTTDVGKRNAQADGQVGLRIHVDAEDAVAELGQRAAEVDGARRLADAALLIRQRDDFGQGKHLPRIRFGLLNREL